MPIEKITCVQFDGEFPDFCYRLIMPDYGMPLIGTMLAHAGYDVRIYLEHIQPAEPARIADSDLLCLSTLNAGADKTFRFARDVRQRLGIPIVIGGTQATYFPEACLEHCDYVVLGEGDETIVELVDTLARGGDVAQVAGIAYRDGDRIRRTRPRPGPTKLDIIPNFDLIAGYRRLTWLDLLVQRRKTRLVPMQSSRGCPYHCTFCIVNTMFASGYRKRDIDAVVRDLKDKRRYGRHVMFVDNEFAAQRTYTKRLLRRLIDERLDFDFGVFARVEIAKDDDLLDLMRRAGISYVYQGYESVQPETLMAYDKRQTLEQMVFAIEKLQRYGFDILGSFVLGADTDTLETIRRTVAFIIERNLASAYLWPIWGHFPEERAGYQTIIPWWRSIFRGWAYCDGHHVTHFPRLMRPSQLQRGLIDAYRAMYAPARIVAALRRGRWKDARWKIGNGWVWRDIEPGPRAYVAFLEELEDGLYDAEDRLREDVLIERVRRDPRWAFQAGNRAVETVGVSPLELPLAGKRNITCLPPNLGGA